MNARLQDRPAMRRLSALGLLALGLWVVVPPLLGPIDAWRDAHAALRTEQELTERLARQSARRGAVAALAAQPEPPFLMAADAAGAAAALASRLTAAVPAGAMRLQIEPPPPMDERPGAPVSLRFTFEATDGAFYAFLSDIQTRRPALRVVELSASSAQGVDGSIVMTGFATVSAVPLLRAAP